MTIRENDFSRIDLNLLVVLMVLFRERSVSVAAQKLHLGQPAVSGALSRLREMFDDPLFVRSSREMTPTPRAIALAEALSPLLEQMQSALFQPPSFDPATGSPVFRIGMTDWTEMWLMPSLAETLRIIAPGVNLKVISSDPFIDAEKLEQGDLDISLSTAKESASWLRRERLTTMEPLAVWSPQQLSYRAPLSLQDYIQPEHLLVTYRSANTSQADERLAAQGLARTIRYTTPHFSSLPFILQNTPAIATVPSGLATRWQQQYGLSFSPVPLELPCSEISLLWHSRREKDLALQWLIQAIRHDVKTLLAQK